MALYKYFQPAWVASQSDPQGPLSVMVPTSSITAANAKVTALLEPSGSKRVSYAKHCGAEGQDWSKSSWARCSINHTALCQAVARLSTQREQRSDPPRRRNSEQTDNILRGTCLTVTRDLTTATTKGSWRFPRSLRHSSSSPRLASQALWYSWYPRTIASTVQLGFQVGVATLSAHPQIF